MTRQTGRLYCRAWTKEQDDAAVWLVARPNAPLPAHAVNGSGCELKPRTLALFHFSLVLSLVTSLRHYIVTSSLYALGFYYVGHLFLSQL